MDIFGFILMVLAFFFLMRKKRTTKPQQTAKRRVPPRVPVHNSALNTEAPIKKSPTPFPIPPPSPQHVAGYTVFPSPASVSKGKRLIQKLPSKKELIIMREIMSPPKSAGAIRPHEFWD